MRDREVFVSSIAVNLVTKLSLHNINGIIYNHQYDPTIEFEYCCGKYDIVIYAHAGNMEFSCAKLTKHHKTNLENPRWLWPVICRTGPITYKRSLTQLSTDEINSYIDMYVEDLLKQLKIISMQDIIET